VKLHLSWCERHGYRPDQPSYPLSTVEQGQGSLSGKKFVTLRNVNGTMGVYTYHMSSNRLTRWKGQ
jgi:hypothetical protein